MLKGVLCSPRAHRQTDRHTDRHESEYRGHPFRVSGIFPSTYHQGTVQQLTCVVICSHSHQLHGVYVTPGPQHHLADLQSYLLGGEPDLLVTKTWFVECWGVADGECVCVCLCVCV